MEKSKLIGEILAKRAKEKILMRYISIEGKINTTVELKILLIH